MPTSAPTPSRAPSRRSHHEDPLLNRSVERSVEILRAFRPGTYLLGNGEIAERTGLPRASVSRLTQTLVDTGFLEHVRSRRAYRLAAPILGLAHAMRSGSSMLGAVVPLMRALAEKMRINVGLAVPDRDEMIYLESVRYNRRVSLRNVVSGQRVPMELTSLGRAYLAVAHEAAKRELFANFKSKRPKDWQHVLGEIQAAKLSVEKRGFCSAAWQPEVVALSTPIALPDRPVYVLNVSVSSSVSVETAERQLSEQLLNLREKLVVILQASA